MNVSIHRCAHNTESRGAFGIYFGLDSFGCYLIRFDGFGLEAEGPFEAKYGTQLWNVFARDRHKRIQLSVLLHF